MLTVFHPETAAHFAARDALLQRALRPEPLPFSIAAEYPLVLAHGAAARSFCFADTATGELVAHANLLTREVVPGSLLSVGLVGNVATDERWRGRGVMRSVFEVLGERAAEAGLGAMFLWSDLQEFYQKLGFGSFGAEWRFLFDAAALAARRGGYSREAAPAAAKDAAALVATRFAHRPTLARSGEETRTLLAIPATELFVRRDARGEPAGYMVMGKGYDLAGVVHEWGAPSPEALLGGLGDVARASGLETLMLLAPGELPREWHRALAAEAESVERHPMALMRALREGAAEEVRELFVWGLDSI